MMKKTGKCTFGIPSNLIEEAGGLFQFLFNHGVKQLIHLKFHGSTFKQIARRATYDTKYGKVRKWIQTSFKVHGVNIDLEDLINDMLENDLPSNRQVNIVTFKDPINNQHVYTLTRPSRNSYRVSQIDGKSIMEGFTREDISKLYKDSFFESIGGFFCEIYKSPMAQFQIECKPIGEEESE